MSGFITDECGVAVGRSGVGFLRTSYTLVSALEGPDDEYDAG